MHWDQAQTRPDHGAGTSMELDPVDSSSKPVFDSWAAPPPVNVAGQIVSGQLFVIWNVADSTPT